jgi:hypothetical protein
MMHRLMTLGFAFVAVVVLGSAASGLASASAAGLPRFTVETKFTGASGKSKLGLKGAEITCSSGSDEGTPTSKQAGSLTIGFKGCKLAGTECHSLGGTKEIVEISGIYALVKLKSEDAGLLISPKEVHIECPSLSTLVLLRGELLGLVTPLNTKTTKYTDKENVKEGKQEYTEYENSTGASEKVLLEGSINGGEFKVATEEVAENTLTTASETELIEGKGPLTIDASPRALSQAARNGTMKIKNTSATEQITVNAITVLGEEPAGSFTQNAGELAACRKVYNAGQECTWAITYNGMARSKIDIFYTDLTGGVGAQIVTGQ